MKTKIVLIALLLLLVLSGCGSGNDTPILNMDTYPYVVTSIVKYNESMSRYYSANNGHYTDKGMFGEDRCLIAPTGLYNVGDTVICVGKRH